ncbi:MAG: HEAT repeat domain-containing protein [bacterium]|nr:HEAT repeat domain-containing protein [bacterium]
MIEILEKIKQNFERWDFPLGPFISEEEVRVEMTQFAKQLGEKDSDDFVEALLWMLENEFPHVEVAYEFVDIYTQNYGDALAQALLKNITPRGPELLVELIGPTKSRDAVKVLEKTLSIETAEPELLIALIGALGEIGGEEAVSFLNRVKELQLPGEVGEELEIAFKNIEYEI